MLALKLLLIPASILLATLVARRFGHTIGGIVSGLPMVAGPIIAILLLDYEPRAVSRIVQATLVTVPATFAFIVSYAWLTARLRWWGCLAVSALVFAVTGLALTTLSLPTLLVWLVALACPALSLAALPKVPMISGGVGVPRSEIVMRMTSALLVGAAIMLGADRFPTWVSGLLLAWPITGSILPSFTLPLYGRVAAVNLLRGFVTGLVGFVLFMVTLAAMLDAGWHPALSFALAFGAAAAAAAGVHAWRHRRDPRRTGENGQRA